VSYTFLQEQGEESSAESFSDIPAFVLSRLSLTAEKFCCNGSEMESCQSSQSGMTCEHSTENRGEDSLMLCAEDFHAKTLAQQERGLESTENEVDYGKKWQGWFAKLDPATSLWKIPQCSLFEDSEPSLEIWPKWGMMRDGECSELPIRVPNIPENESGFLPTPMASDSDGGGVQRSKNGKEYNLRDWWANMGLGKRPQQRRPEFWEWVMGWPEHWTALDQLEMDKFQAWLSSHGKPCLPNLPESPQSLPSDQ